MVTASQIIQDYIIANYGFSAIVWGVELDANLNAVGCNPLTGDPEWCNSADQYVEVESSLQIVPTDKGILFLVKGYGRVKRVLDLNDPYFFARLDKALKQLVPWESWKRVINVCTIWRNIG